LLPAAGPAECCCMGPEELAVGGDAADVGAAVVLGVVGVLSRGSDPGDCTAGVKGPPDGGAAESAGGWASRAEVKEVPAFGILSSCTPADADLGTGEEAVVTVGEAASSMLPSIDVIGVALVASRSRGRPSSSMREDRRVKTNSSASKLPPVLAPVMTPASPG
jgi:hypothetical protein